jgi:negative regulator of sigma-B (phosphoserine phosphatase)
VDGAALIDWGVAALTLAGERESGDLHLVKPIGTGVLVSVVDGLGHGADAAAAARAAVAALNRHAQESVLLLLQRCHQALAGTRGVVVSVALFDRTDGSMTWLGVGNVEGLLLYADGGGRRGRERLVTRGGIVGSELPPLRPEVLAVSPGDTLILATDGVHSGFADDLTVDAPPQQLADQILKRCGKSTDDALVLVARYVGDAGAKG